VTFIFVVCRTVALRDQLNTFLKRGDFFPQKLKFHPFICVYARSLAMIVSEELQHKINVVGRICHESFGSHRVQDGIKFRLDVRFVDLICHNKNYP
jgi:hypothetical protein